MSEGGGKDSVIWLFAAGIILGLVATVFIYSLFGEIRERSSSDVIINGSQVINASTGEVIGELKSIGEGTLERTDELAKKEVEVPEKLDWLAKFAGFEEKIKLKSLIIYLCILLIFALIFISMFTLVGPFSEGTGILAGLLVTLMLVALKGVKRISDFIESQSWWMIWIVVILIVAALATRGFKWLAGIKEKEKAEEEGAQVGADLGFLSSARNMLGRIFKRKKSSFIPTDSDNP